MMRYTPGSGFAERTGKGEGKGFNINVPLPRSAKDEDVFKAFNEQLSDDAKGVFKSRLQELTELKDDLDLLGIPARHKPAPQPMVAPTAPPKRRSKKSTQSRKQEIIVFVETLYAKNHKLLQLVLCPNLLSAFRLLLPKPTTTTMTALLWQQRKQSPKERNTSWRRKI